MVTNVLAMKWNKILINGQFLEKERLFNVNNRVSVLVPSGSGTIRYSLELPSWYKWMNKIGQVTWFSWLLANPVLAGIGIIIKIRKITC